AKEQQNAITGQTIVVTEYENPSSFRYITVDDLEVNGKVVCQVELQLEAHCQDSNKETHYERSQYVVVRYHLRKTFKYLRGKVLRFKGDDIYLVQSLDYGFRFLCRYSDLWLLPRKCVHQHLEVLRGGLYGVAALGNVAWSQTAVDLLHYQLTKAVCLKFTVKYYCQNRRHNYGNLLIQSAQPSEAFIDAAGYLLEHHCARRDHQLMLTTSCESTASVLRSVQLNEPGSDPNPYVATVLQLIELHRTKFPLHETPEGDLNNSSTLHLNNRCNNKLPKLTPPFEQSDRLESLCRMSAPRAIPKSARSLSAVRFNNERSVNTAFISASGSSSSSAHSSSNSLSLKTERTLSTLRQMHKNVDVNKFPRETVNLSALNPAADQMNPKQPTLVKQKLDRIYEELMRATSVKGVKEFKTSDASRTSVAATQADNAKPPTLGKEKLDNDSIGSEFSAKQSGTSAVKTQVIKSKQPTLDKEKLHHVLPSIPSEQLLLAHSQERVYPLQSWPRSLFDQDVAAAMQALHICRPLSMQRYAWSHLMECNSLLVIAPPGQGRSWCYLPTLCSRVISSMRETPTSQQLGPLAVLVADSEANACLLSKQCSCLMRGYATKQLKVVNTHEHAVLDVQLMLLNSCGILVTTLCHWHRLLRNTELSCIDAHRLQHFVLDDYDRMLSAVPDLLSQVLQRLRQLAFPQLQLILIAQQWHGRRFLPLAKHFNRNPLLLFADFFEAAIYGNVKLNIKLLHSSNKAQQLIDYLAGHVSRTRTIIYCKSDGELLDLQMSLRASGYECIGVNEALQQQNHELLLLSDAGELPAVLPIKNFGLLVHYSLPASWSRFSHRFHALIDNIANRLVPECQTDSGDIVSYMLLDESNQSELPQLARLLSAHDIQLDEQLQQLVASCRRLSDQQRAFCQQLRSSGECRQLACHMRHFPVASDFRGLHYAVWQPGNVVRCQLIDVHNPVHFVMMAESYKASHSDNWQDVHGRQLSNALRLHMSQEQHQRRQQELSMSQICVIRRGNGFQRVRITDLSDQRLVTVQQLDEGRALLKLKRSELLQCDGAFEAVAPVAMEVRLCGVRSRGSEDGHWAPEASEWVSSKLCNLQHQQHLQLVVEFAMLDTVYVREVVLWQDCPSLRTAVKVVQLQRELLAQEFGQLDEQSVSRLRRMHQACLGAQAEQGDLVEQGPLAVDSNDWRQRETEDVLPPQLKHEASNSTCSDDVSGCQEELEESAPLAELLNILLKDLQSNEHMTKAVSRNEIPVKRLSTPEKIIPKAVSQAIVCAAIAGNVVRPKVRWHQTLLHIELIFEQQVPHYQLIHEGCVLIYAVQATTPPQRCILNLLGDVHIVSQRQHGYQLQVKLAKRAPVTYWPTLLSSLTAQQHCHWLVYDAERAKLPQSQKCLLNWTRYVERSTRIPNSYSDDDEGCNFSDEDE
ncbi:hypothetical protein KR093_007640, partial [Drosophila rubida]